MEKQVRKSQSGHLMCLMPLCQFLCSRKVVRAAKVLPETNIQNGYFVQLIN